MARKLKGDEDFAGLKTVEKTLPGHAYYDPAVYARELDNIWHRQWIYLCRSDALAGPGSYRTETIAAQSVLLLRDEAGTLRAFHNTCRHRGSLLCREEAGRLGGKRIVCPYHQWAYNLQGRLVRTSSLSEAPDFSTADYPLYDIAVREWRGCVFVCLSHDPPQDLSAFRGGGDHTDNWPLAELAVGHTWRETVACNWKVFWENFNECLHCPNVHPELSRLVPIYRRRIILPQDDPDWRRHEGSADPKHRGGLKAGAETWSGDGKVHGPRFEGLSAAERAAGQRYYVNTPSVYIAAHVDYVRIVRVLPRGPEQTELRAEWLFPPATLEDPAFDLANVVEFGRLVLEQDGTASEVNQQGLRSIRHETGVLMPEEHYVADFHRWYRTAMGEG